MKRVINELHTELGDVALMASEKAAIKSRIILFMNEHPLPVPSDDWYGIRSPFHIRPLHTVRVVLSVLTIAMLVGGSVAAAAEGSLPGDVLYAIKVNVNEEVRSAVTVSSEGQAKWDAERAARRLQEAEKLAVEGRLDAPTTAQLEAKFEEHAQESITHANESKDPSTKAAVHSQIEATLEAHGAVIRNLMDENKALEAQLGGVQEVVAEKAEVSEDARIAAEDELASATTTLQEELLKDEKWELKDKIDTIERTFDQIEGDLNAAFADEIDAKFDLANSMYARGKKFLKDEKFDKATAAFQQTERSVTEANVLLSVGEVLADVRKEIAREHAEEEEVQGEATTTEGTTTPPEETTANTSTETSIATSSDATSTAPVATSTFQKLKTNFGL